jgi:hypothetical protein
MIVISADAGMASYSMNAALTPDFCIAVTKIATASVVMAGLDPAIQSNRSHFGKPAGWPGQAGP